MKKRFHIILACILFAPLLPSVYARAAESAPYTRDDAVEYVAEGVDTEIEITDYTQYSGDPGFSFLSEGDKIAVLSPSALPDRERTEATLAGLRRWGFEPNSRRTVRATTAQPGEARLNRWRR